MIEYEDFAKLDLRVGKIISAEPIPNKTKIVKGVVDIGTEQRVVIIGGAEFYTISELINRIVIVIVNLQPKIISNIESTAMLLAADVQTKPFWLTLSENDLQNVPLGSTIR